MTGKPLIDEYDFVDPKQAVCPTCSRQVMMVDEDDEIFFCTDGKEPYRGCNWSGKLCQLNFKSVGAL